MVKRPREPAADGLENGEDGPDFASAVLQLEPREAFESAAREAMEAVNAAVKAVFGTEAYVQPYGSLVQGMHLDGSDLDLCIEVPGEDLVGPVGANGKTDNGLQVAALKRLMRKLPNTFRVTETRFWKHMKVPIIILAFRSASGEEVETDISVGAVFEGVQKGFTDRLVRRLLARLPRAIHLARLVKLWARLEKLNKAYDGFLNSLGWTLMVLFFFIERGEITCDMLHEEEPNENGPDGDGGYSRAALENKLSFCQCYAKLELKRVVEALPASKVGCSLLLARDASGSLFVCKVTVCTVQGDDGRVYCVHIHEDAGVKCSIEKLLEIVGTGDYFKLLRSMRMEHDSPGETTWNARALASSILHSLMGVLLAEEQRSPPPDASAAGLCEGEAGKEDVVWPDLENSMVQRVLQEQRSPPPDASASGSRKREAGKEGEP